MVVAEGVKLCTAKVEEGVAVSIDDIVAFALFQVDEVKDLCCLLVSVNIVMKEPPLVVAGGGDLDAIGLLLWDALGAGEQ